MKFLLELVEAAGTPVRRGPLLESIAELVIHCYVPETSREYILRADRDKLRAFEEDADPDELSRLQSLDAQRMVLPIINRIVWRRGRLRLRLSGGSGNMIFKGCVHVRLIRLEKKFLCYGPR